MLRGVSPWNHVNKDVEGDALTILSLVKVPENEQLCIDESPISVL